MSEPGKGLGVIIKAPVNSGEGEPPKHNFLNDIDAAEAECRFGMIYNHPVHRKVPEDEHTGK